MKPIRLLNISGSERAGSYNLQLAGVAAAAALLFVTPEYNAFPTPLVLNAFDWMSRIQGTAEGGAGLAATGGKPAALLSASPGPLGGLRSMNLLRQKASQ